ncbi:phosphatase PAP2 family protein [Streptomyces sp. NPDC048436]|uniref:phosphatase PAP2 family protein n=1 Tax=Streptomyces sp. NPDC048436 TaxID=3365550 RepID=UPI003710B75E
MHPAPLASPPRRPRPPGYRAALTAVLLCVPSTLLILLVGMEWAPLLGLDDDIARTTHRWAVADDGLTRASRILTDWVWDPWTMRALCAVTVVWLAFRGAWWLGIWLAATCVVGSVIQQALKALVDRPRPQWPDPVDSAHYAAFPSGHAMTATVVCGLLLWLLRVYRVGSLVWRTGLALAVVSVVGVGLTRIWNGVHWPSDIVGGWLLGALMVALAVATYEYRPGARAVKSA